MLKRFDLRWETINLDKSHKNSLRLLISRPGPPLSTLVQGVWSASVVQASPLEKTLHADAGSGVIFNLSGEVTIDNETLTEGIIMLPVKSKAGNVLFTSGAKLAGIRFHPAAGYSVMMQHYDKPTLLTPEQDNHSFYQIYSELRIKKDNKSRVKAIYQWTAHTLKAVDTIPDSLEQALKLIGQVETLAALSAQINMSQRQIERHFRLWLGITPKHYQRILRAKAAIDFLRKHSKANLAEVAFLFGYSDQAHMTREFHQIACVTPGRIKLS